SAFCPIPFLRMSNVFRAIQVGRFALLVILSAALFMFGFLFGSQPSRAGRAVVPVEQPPWVRAQNVRGHARAVTKKNIKITTEKSAPATSLRLACLPRLLSSSYLLGNLTEASIQRWRGILDPTNKWVQMAKTYNDLWKPYFDLLQPFSFVSDSEVKYFVNFTRPHDECNVITMGIGGTVDGEKELLKRYPQCTFLGVDPNSEENRNLVESIPRATFVQAAVAGGTGKRQAYLKQKNGAYSGAHVDHIGFIDLLKTLNGKRTVDLLILDVEGAEYGILPLLT
ncbi:Protein K01D12.1, partial [Aphelenchoides avenae]